MTERPGWGAQVWRAVRRMPILLLLLVLYTAALLATMGFEIARQAGLIRCGFAMFGIVSFLLGLMLAGDVAGSAGAMQRLADATAHGPWGLSSISWTAGRFRFLGAFLIVFATALMVVMLTGHVKT